MRKNTITCLLVPLFVCMWLSICFTSSGQELARFTYKSFDKDSPPDQNTNNSISLKDAVNQVKKFYKIKIAYREGLLDGKNVPVSIISEMKSHDVESALKLLLTNYQLNYKKTGSNQFSLYEIVSGQTIISVYAIPVAGKITSSKDGAVLPRATISIK